MMFELTVVHRECGSLTLSRFTALFVEVGTKQSIARRCEIVRGKGSDPLSSEVCEGSRHEEEGHPPASRQPPAECPKTLG